MCVMLIERGEEVWKSINHRRKVDIENAEITGVSIEKYCRENGISYAKLKEQRFECLDNFGCFLQSSEIEPQGLKMIWQLCPK